MRKLVTFNVSIHRPVRFLLVLVLVLAPVMIVQRPYVSAVIPGPPDEYLDVPVKAQSGSGVLWVGADGRYALVGSNTALINDGQGQGTFLRDRLNGTTTRLSTQNPATYAYAGLTPDLKEAVITTNMALVSHDTNGTFDVYVQNMLNNTYELISSNNLGISGNGVSTTEGGQLNISNNGRFVVYKSSATNLSSGNDNNGGYDVFLRDRFLGVTERLSTNNSGDAADGDSGFAQISRDGKVVVFSTDASTIGEISVQGRKVVAKGINDDMLEVVSLSKLGEGQNGAYCIRPTLSSNGRFVGFTCGYAQLLPGVQNPSLFHAYRYDILSNELKLVDINSNGEASDTNINGYIAISGDGARMAYIDQQGLIFYRDLSDSTGSKAVSQGSSGEIYLSEDGHALAVNHYGARPALWRLPEAPEVPIDDLAPVVTGAATGEPNDNGWYNAPVNVHWTVVDPEPSSGISTSPADIVAGLEGVNTYLSVDACDNVGNCATGGLELKIDTIPPEVERHRRHFLFNLLHGKLAGSVHDDTSGIAKVVLTDGNRNTSSEDGEIKLYCATDRKECRWSIRLHHLKFKRQNLKLVITDYAGNTTTKELLQKD